MTTQTQQIHRRTNGMIDIDHYRSHSLMLRRVAMSNMARSMNISVLRLVVAVARIVALIVMPPHAPVTKGAVSNGAAITVVLEPR